VSLPSWEGEGLLDWNGLRSTFVTQLARAKKIEVSAVEQHIPLLPDTAVDRVLWLEGPAVQEPLHWALDATCDLRRIARLLLNDIEHADLSPAPNREAKRLIDLSLGKPELLYGLVMFARWHPIVLADLLFVPETCALACLIVAQCPAPSAAWDGDVVIPDFRMGKLTAFTDAVALLEHFLSRGAVPPEEATALLTWLQGKAMHSSAGVEKLWGGRRRSWHQAPYKPYEPMLAILRRALAVQPAEVLTAMLASLMQHTGGFVLGAPAFVAALDIIALGVSGVNADPAPLVRGYLANIRGGDYGLTARGITALLARELLAMARRLGPAGLGEFFAPIDVRARLAAGSEDNPYTLADTIGRSLRIHIRVLCRSIVGSDVPPPDDLVAATADAIRLGSVTHKEKGKVSAFASRLETQWSLDAADRPIAADLGAALTRLDESAQKLLLAAILEIDEPMVLARLISFVPAKLRSAIETRIMSIRPPDAAEIYSLTEMQRRLGWQMPPRALWMKSAISRPLGRSRAGRLSSFGPRCACFSCARIGRLWRQSRRPRAFRKMKNWRPTMRSSFSVRWLSSRSPAGM
jgi:hypothetical protein